MRGTRVASRPLRARQRTAPGPWWPICGARPPGPRIPRPGAKQKQSKRTFAFGAVDSDEARARAGTTPERRSIGERRPGRRHTPPTSHQERAHAVPVLRRGCAGSTRAHVGWAGSVTWSVSRHRRAARLRLGSSKGGRLQRRAASELTRVSLCQPSENGDDTHGSGNARPRIIIL